MTYEESGLTFQFSPGWIVRRYDAHKFYIGLSGAGLKGVDFIAFHPGQRRLLFIEVKNFRPRNPKHTLSAQRTDPKVLADKMSAKIHDTVLAIDAIMQHYRRRWWYGLLVPLLRRSTRYHSDHAYWPKVSEMIQDGHLEAVLWLELEQPDVDFEEQVSQQCVAQLADLGVPVLIASMAHNPLAGIVAVA